MELKEIWQKEEDAQTEGSKAPPAQLSAFRSGFHNGCLFENNRSHWLDPEKELPPYDIHNGSIVVLVKKKDGTIQSGYYDFFVKEWAFQGVEITNVISWAYIPK